MQKQILDKPAIDRMVQRLAYEIIEQNYTENNIVLIGIVPGGVVLAQQIKAAIAQIGTIACTMQPMVIDKKNPVWVETNTIPALKDAVVVLIDDVSMTGRTISYAMVPVLLSAPKKVQTLVLVEREQKLFPVMSNYVGMHISTTLQEQIVVIAENEQLVTGYLQ